MQQIPFIDVFKSALHVSGYELAHLQEHFLTVYTAFGTVQCTDIAVDRSPVHSNIGALYQKLYIQSKSAPEDGRVWRPKHVEQI